MTDHQLTSSMLDFVTHVERLRTPAAVLDALNGVSHERGLTPLAVWYLPRVFKDQQWAWQLDETLFVHRSVPKDYWPRFRKLYEENGYSFMTVKARQRSVPFTIAEAEKEAKARRARNRWVFGFMRSYNFNDGLYCPFRRWNCIFVSPQLLALAPGGRALLAAAAQFAVGRIEDIAMQPRKGRKTGNLLTPRECEVLQSIAVIGDNAGVAKALNISLVSVDTHLSKARKKLGVKSTGQALLTAFKNRLIEY